MKKYHLAQFWHHRCLVFAGVLYFEHYPPCLPTLRAGKGKSKTLLGKSLPGPPEDQVCCRRCRPRGCTGGRPHVAARPPARAPAVVRRSRRVARHTAAGWPTLGGTGSSQRSHLGPRRCFMNSVDTSPAKEHHW